MVSKNWPHRLLAPAELKKLLDAPNVETGRGLRDRAILETMISAKPFSYQIAAVRQIDVNIVEKTIRFGFGGKCVPISERALSWIARYQREVRPKPARLGKGGDYLFLSKLGQSVSRTVMNDLVGRYLRQIGLDHFGGCSLIRHSAFMAELKVAEAAYTETAKRGEEKRDDAV